MLLCFLEEVCRTGSKPLLSLLDSGNFEDRCMPVFLAIFFFDNLDFRTADILRLKRVPLTGLITPGPIQSKGLSSPKLDSHPGVKSLPSLPLLVPLLVLLLVLLLVVRSSDDPASSSSRFFCSIMSVRQAL